MEHRLSDGLRDVEIVETKEKANTKQAIRESYGKDRDLSKVTVIPATQAPAPLSSHKKQRVAVYCRVSTDGISQTTSFELQKKYYFNYVKKREEWTLYAIYSDEGITATNTVHRQGLLQMLDDARAGKFDIIVVKNLSRLSRNLMDCMNIVKELRNLPEPVGILFESENMYTLGENMDFTIQILSLVAQEESHKKSEAMFASYGQRFSLGNYMVPDILGFFKSGINQIQINPEEAKTVQLIFMMFLAGSDIVEIVGTLVELKRKNHLHVKKDGTTKGGEVKWSVSYLRHFMQNEKVCGDVLAQKTYTIDWQMHKSVKNNNKLPQYYAREHHDAIISPADFLVAQKMLMANKRGWKYGLPEMEVYRSGFFSGYITPAPAWIGFNPEDYNRATLSAYGEKEDKLNAIAAGIDEMEKRKIEQIQEELKKQASWDDDYVVFGEGEEKKEVQEAPSEKTFTERIRECAQKYKIKVDKKSISNYDFSDMDLVRAQLFSMRSKLHFTLDKNAITFSKSCINALMGDKAGLVQHVEIKYNPVEKIMSVSEAQEEGALSLSWAKEYPDRISMKKCPCKGIAESVFVNMGWNKDYRYRVLGECIEVDGKKHLAFYLEDPIIMVSAKKEEAPEESSIMSREVLPEDVGDLPVYELECEGDKTQSRSRAIYFNSSEAVQETAFFVEDLGDDKYTPETIKKIIEKGTSPVQGWYYLDGMAVLTKRGFTIYPAEWNGNFGSSIYCRESAKLTRRLKDRITAPESYGWTVGLDLPTRETVEKAIQSLRSEQNAGKDVC